MTKIEKKNRIIILGSEFSEAKNEPTFRLYQIIDKQIEKKIENLFLGQNCLKIFEFLTPKKNTKNREKKIKKLFLAQNGLKQIMSQLLDYIPKN